MSFYGHKILQEFSKKKKLRKMVQRKDYLIGAIVGVFTGVLALFIFSFLKISFKFQMPFFLLIVPLLWAAGVWLGGFLGKWPATPDGTGKFPFFNQFGKFVAVGFLNTAIDFSILNLISSETGITSGLTIGWINMPGFLVATVNGYLWNKLWVFSIGDKKENNIFANFPKFLAVTTSGLFINSLLVVVFTTFLNFGTPSDIWLNISKVAATSLTFVWNFTGYKYIAFSAKGGFAFGEKK